MSNQKILVPMLPYDAIHLLGFLRENINETNDQVPAYKSLHESVSNFEKAIAPLITDEMYTAIEHEFNVNEMIGKMPTVKFKKRL